MFRRSWFHNTLILFSLCLCGLSVPTSRSSAEALTAVVVSGHAYLEDQLDNSGIKVLFADQPGSAERDSTYTDATGFYSRTLSAGVYRVYFSRDGYVPFPFELPGPWVFGPPDVTLSDVTLDRIGIEISGPQHGVFTSGNLYSVMGDVEVPAGDSLRIEPGVRIEFLGPYAFTVDGRLVAQGSPGDSIRFVSAFNPPVGWGGLHFASQEENLLSHVVVEQGGIGVTGRCRLENSDLTSISQSTASSFAEIDDCIVSAGISVSSAGSILLRHSMVHSADTKSWGLDVYGAALAVVEDNALEGGGGFPTNDHNGIGAVRITSVDSLLVHGNTITFLPCYTFYYSGRTTGAMDICGAEGRMFSNIVYLEQTGSDAPAWAGIVTCGIPIIERNIIVGGDLGIRNYGATPVVSNVIMNCQTAVDGPAFYNNYYNSGGNQICTTNANGDPCDTYYNIYMDPKFVDPTNGDYHLQADSPCINAGDPASSLDPDGTVADIGAFYFPLDNPGPPELQILAAPTTGPLSLGVDFTCVDTGGPITSYHWSFGDGRTSSTWSPVHTYTEAGSFIVRLNVTGPGGMDSDSTTISVLPANSPPQCDFAAQPRSGFSGLAVSFNSIVVGQVDTYHWTFGDGGESADANPTHAYADTDSFTVCLTVTNAYGQDEKCKAGYIVVHEAGTVHADFTFADSIGVAPMSVDFTNLSLGVITSTHWWFGDGGESTAQNPPPHIYDNPGTYFPKLKVTGPGGADSLTSARPIRVYARAPRIVSVEDVADDQGGKVWVRWLPSGLDGAVRNGVIGYNLWLRRASGEWSRVGATLAAQDSVYSLLAPTLADSTADRGIHWSVFRVTAHTTDPGAFYASAADSGYSVDNLPPSVPGNPRAAYQTVPSRILVTWDPAPEHDLKFYAVHRDSVEAFTPGPTTLLGLTTAPLFSDSTFQFQGTSWYRVLAVDLAGNRGDASVASNPVQPAGTLGEGALTAYALGTPMPVPARGRVTMQLALPEPAHVTVVVYALDGSRVATLSEGTLASGRRAVNWAGRDERGRPVPSGVYVVRMEAQGESRARFVQDRKLIWIR